jgi:hypothetical protein
MNETPFPVIFNSNYITQCTFTSTVFSYDTQELFLGQVFALCKTLNKKTIFQNAPKLFLVSSYDTQELFFGGRFLHSVKHSTSKLFFQNGPKFFWGFFL